MVGRRGKEQLSGYCINIEQLSTVSYNYVDRLNNKTWLKELLEVLVVGKGFFLRVSAVLILSQSDSRQVTRLLSDWPARLRRVLLLL